VYYTSPEISALVLSKKIMRKLSIVFLCIPALFLSGASVQAQSTIPATEISGFSHPESVIQSGNSLFISNIGAALDPAKKDGDGFISKVDLSTGKITDLHYLPANGTLDAPKGMALIGRTLYVADIDHIVGFDIESREKVFDLTITGSTFLNDLVMGDGKLYVSATDNGKIYEIDPLQKTYQALALKDSIAGANGLFFDHISRTLYCVSLGSWGKWDGMLFAINLKDMTFKKIATYQGMLDGVDIVGNTLYFSDWKGMDKKGNLFSLNLKTHAVHELSLTVGGIAGPADFSVSTDHRYFIIPSTIEGKLYFEKR
jgi:outer membrane protein assembly factor BamB